MPGELVGGYSFHRTAPTFLDHQSKYTARSGSSCPDPRPSLRRLLHYALMTATAPWWEIVHERFKANGITLVVRVPDAARVGLIGACEADPEIEVLQLTREEEGVGILSGAYLGGKRGALLMQSSGLGNTVNALGGLPMAYRIPFLILITPRGRLSEFNPSQVPAGRAVPKVLDALGIEMARSEEHTSELQSPCN